MNVIRFVRTEDGVYLLQVENEDVFLRDGFALVDDEGGTYQGGFGIASSWRIVPDDEVPDDVRERFQPIIESFEE